MSNHQANIHKKEEELKEAEAKASRLRHQLCKMRKSTKLSCSDHAVVRYQERVKLRPVGEVLSSLLCPKVQQYYQDLGDGTYPIGEGSTRVLIKNGVIVTVLI